MADTMGTTGAEKPTARDVEADIRQLQEDLAALKEQLARTGEHGIGAAKRAAAEGVEQLKAQGEAAMAGVKDKAQDIEEELTARVREKPITSLAVAAAIGYVFALISNR
jgi:ElaB/YqjD/DUF883 family membrane-anchored ribosome-binding protein